MKENIFNTNNIFIIVFISVPVPLNIGSLEELQPEETAEPATKRFRIQGQGGQSYVLTVAGRYTCNLLPYHMFSLKMPFWQQKQ